MRKEIIFFYIQFFSLIVFILFPLIQNWFWFNSFFNRLHSEIVEYVFYIALGIYLLSIILCLLVKKIHIIFIVVLVLISTFIDYVWLDQFYGNLMFNRTPLYLFITIIVLRIIFIFKEFKERING